MNTIQFFAEGVPKGQPRPKAFSRGGHAAVYDPGTAEGWKGQVAMAAKHKRPEGPLEGPLELILGFYFPRPKSHFRTGKNAHILKKGVSDFHTSKPDSDNLAKAVMDAMTQLGFWVDDSQVCHLSIRKFYCNNTASAGCAISLVKI